MKEKLLCVLIVYMILHISFQNHNITLQSTKHFYLDRVMIGGNNVFEEKIKFQYNFVYYMY